MELLPAWLGDASGSRAGVGFAIVQIVLQLLIAVNVGFLAGHRFGSSTTGGLMQLWFLMGLQAFAAIFTGIGTANEFWGGLFTSMAYAIECAASCLLLRAAYVTAAGSEKEDAEKEASVLEAISLSATAANLLMINLFAPIGLTVYDTFVVPVYMKIKKEDAGTPLEVGWAILQALILVPLQVIGGLFGIGGNAADIIENATTFANEAATSAALPIDLIEDEGEEGEEGDGDRSNQVEPFREEEDTPIEEVGYIKELGAAQSSALAPRHSRSALDGEVRPPRPNTERLDPNGSPMMAGPPALNPSPGVAEREDTDRSSSEPSSTEPSRHIVLPFSSPVAGHGPSSQVTEWRQRQMARSMRAVAAAPLPPAQILPQRRRTGDPVAEGSLFIGQRARVLPVIPRNS